MDFVSIPTIISCIAGTFVHIVKKGVEQENEGTLSAIKRWLVGKPANTIVAAATGVGVAMGIQMPEGTPEMYQYILGFLAGFSGSSLINRPGR